MTISAVHTAVVLGADRMLVLLLAGVLWKMGLHRIEVVRAGLRRGDANLVPAPRLVFATLRAGEPVAHVLEEARAAGDAPIILVLPSSDSSLAREARALGAAGCYALGTPLQQLRDVVSRVLRGHGA